MSAIGRPVRFYADGDSGDPMRPEFDGFDGGPNMAGHDVWVTSQVFRDNVDSDKRRHGATDEDWHEARVHAINNAIVTEHHGILYPLVDCALLYVGEDD